ncbi:hypothetical protein Daus18300_000484 [Diaporthe australafricana]|uniref:Fe2OG dioxygenase domain-containing protein n=1 Tax=Diaporthe australafricana TaxID=127596 RepID=A0ABR3Y3G3_9PEZI
MATETSTAVESQILSGPAPRSATARLIDFKETNLGLYEDFFAMVIDDLVTPRECAALLSAVQPPAPAADNNKPWPPATVTAHDGSQFVDLMSRDCGRIIHESQALADALLDRILPHLPPAIVSLRNAPNIAGQAAVINKETWEIARLDSALRFLKYEPGQYFSPHCDGQYIGKNGAEKSLLTVHLYLNGGGQGDEEIEGGATRFGIDFDNPKEDKLDVDPKIGSVLIFQQRDMYHEGVEVRKGTKYTLRTDVIYEKVQAG